MHSSTLSHCQYPAKIHWVWRNRLVLPLAYTERERQMQTEAFKRTLPRSLSLSDRWESLGGDKCHSFTHFLSTRDLSRFFSFPLCLSYISFHFFKPTFWSNIQTKHRHTVSISVNMWLEDLLNKSKWLYIFYFLFLFILSNYILSFIMKTHYICFCLCFRTTIKVRWKNK